MHQQDPADAFVLFALAKEYERLQLLEVALQHYNRLALLDPNYVGLYYHKGKLLEATGDHQQAIDTYDQGINVARAIQDKHALSELEQARWELAD
jgi:tetratricopeptide (TPR) repeat protein